MTAQALKPRDGSPGHLAMLHLQRTTTATSLDLAIATDLPLADVDRLLTYPVRVGLLARVPEAGHYRYRLGDGVPSDEPIETREPPPPPPPPPPRRPAPAPVPAPAPAPVPAKATKPAAPAPAPKEPSMRIPTFTKVAAGMAVSAAAAKAATHAASVEPSTPVVTVDRSLKPSMDLASLGDVRDVLAEAANLAGVDIDAVHQRQRDRLQVARELVSAVLPVLEVKRFDVARFDGGRLVLDLDGTLYVLPPSTAARLYAYLDTQELR